MSEASFDPVVRCVYGDTIQRINLSHLNMINWAYLTTDYNAECRNPALKSHIMKVQQIEKKAVVLTWVGKMKKTLLGAESRGRLEKNSDFYGGHLNYYLHYIQRETPRRSSANMFPPGNTGDVCWACWQLLGFHANALEKETRSFWTYRT